MLDRKEFVEGVLRLLDPDTKHLKSRALSKRLQRGGHGSYESDFKHVKRVAVLGAGVAGLQVFCVCFCSAQQRHLFSAGAPTK